ncbi:MAG: hypothetical protein ACRD3W_05770, partial [Terriglobales bacterium]
GGGVEQAPGATPDAVPEAAVGATPPQGGLCGEAARPCVALLSGSGLLDSGAAATPAQPMKNNTATGIDLHLKIGIDSSPVPCSSAWTRPTRYSLRQPLLKNHVAVMPSFCAIRRAVLLTWNGAHQEVVANGR